MPSATPRLPSFDRGVSLADVSAVAQLDRPRSARPRSTWPSTSRRKSPPTSPRGCPRRRTSASPPWPRTADTAMLKPIYDQLGGSVSYDQIRLVMTHLQPRDRPSCEVWHGQASELGRGKCPGCVTTANQIRGLTVPHGCNQGPSLRRDLRQGAVARPACAGRRCGAAAPPRTTIRGHAAAAPGSACRAAPAAARSPGAAGPCGRY